MKVTIAFTAAEAPTAEKIKHLVSEQLGKPRIKESEAHPPFKHIYINSGKKS